MGSTQRRILEYLCSGESSKNPKLGQQPLPENITTGQGCPDIAKLGFHAGHDIAAALSLREDECLRAITVLYRQGCVETEADTLPEDFAGPKGQNPPENLGFPVRAAQKGYDALGAASAAPAPPAARKHSAASNTRQFSDDDIAYALGLSRPPKEYELDMGRRLLAALADSSATEETFAQKAIELLSVICVGSGCISAMYDRFVYAFANALHITRFQDDEERTQECADEAITFAAKRNWLRIFDSHSDGETMTVSLTTLGESQLPPEYSRPSEAAEAARQAALDEWLAPTPVPPERKPKGQTHKPAAARNKSATSNKPPLTIDIPAKECFAEVDVAHQRLRVFHRKDRKGRSPVVGDVPLTRQFADLLHVALEHAHRRAREESEEKEDGKEAVPEIVTHLLLWSQDELAAAVCKMDSCDDLSGQQKETVRKAIDRLRRLIRFEPDRSYFIGNPRSNGERISILRFRYCNT